MRCVGYTAHVETLLNLVWVAVASVLVCGVLLGSRRGWLRPSLRVALGCTVVLALLLFPAISMTDDLQLATFDCEAGARHVVAMLLGSLPSFGVDIALFAMLLLLLFASRMATAGMVARRGSQKAVASVRAMFRVRAVRPPPAWSLVRC